MPSDKAWGFSGIPANLIKQAPTSFQGRIHLLVNEILEGKFDCDQDLLMAKVILLYENRLNNVRNARLTNVLVSSRKIGVSLSQKTFGKEKHRFFFGKEKHRWICRVSVIIQARLYRMISQSVFPVSCSPHNVMCLWCSPRRWCLGAANHATDRLEILRVSFVKTKKEGRLW